MRPEADGAVMALLERSSPGSWPEVLRRPAARAADGGQGWCDWRPENLKKPNQYKSYGPRNNRCDALSLWLY